MKILFLRWDENTLVALREDVDRSRHVILFANAFTFTYLTRRWYPVHGNSPRDLGDIEPSSCPINKNDNLSARIVRFSYAQVASGVVFRLYSIFEYVRI